MRFTDNPLEGLMKQKPEPKPKEPDPRPELPPACRNCPYRSTLCEYGICWHGWQRKEDTSGHPQEE